MINLVKAEILKQKHRFLQKLIWIAPILTVLLAIVLMAGSHLQDGAYNWWYTILLPGSFTLFTGLTISGERKKNRHGLLGAVRSKKQLWAAQIILCELFLLMSCLMFFLIVTAGGMIFGSRVSLGRSGAASLLLAVTFAWQIPLWMFITEKAGAFASVILSLVCNFGIGVFSAAEDFWWIPFSIPARLMCPVIGVLPNGLPTEAGSQMESTAVILPGILITAALLGLLSALTSLWFEKREV